ncbi:hypothetical protein B0H17DRAFT_1219832 [Mycena rosella]|uniref:Uncharacterized protein n=1 Tax=Mycena rosella TaxID=1033263 RepID=A0AAD7FED5_MYCRO|nr:hypothetical protein B0H17DRAFT_1219832 [Mycena rosella]
MPTRNVPRPRSFPIKPSPPFSTDSSERPLPAPSPTERPPLSTLSNAALGTLPGTWRTLDKRLQAIVGSLAEIERKLHVQKRDSTSLHDAPTTVTPPRKRARVMRSHSLMASTLDQEEMAPIPYMRTFSGFSADLYAGHVVDIQDDPAAEGPGCEFSGRGGVADGPRCEDSGGGGVADGPRCEELGGGDIEMARGAVAYDAVGYDLLHYFDSGKWGKHVWPCLKEYLQTEKLASKFNDNMSQFPRWRGLKHTPSPTTIDYSDGQTFIDILKSSLPCLVQLLPRNSPFVRIVRVMDKLRIMLGLPVTTRTRLDHLDQLVREYEGASGGLYREFDKDFNFLKQHFLTHARRALYQRARMYDKTNGKNAEHQISRQDENEEPMARIKMAVDEWLKNQTDSDIDASEHRTVSVHRIEAEKRGNPVFRNFNARLREYIARHHPSHSVRLEQEIEIEACKVIYIDYQSTVDWRSARDILRCNPKFHDAPRFDSVMYDTDNDPLAMGQLQFMFRAHLPSGAKLDLATIRPFRKTSWQPKTQTDCPIQEQVSV